MKFTPQLISDIILVQPKIHADSRGYFYESFREDLLAQALGRPISFVQDNESSSQKGVIRGLHFQSPPHAQNKLVRVSTGCILDVAVDIRRNSPTYGQHVAAILSEENKHQLFVPRGFAHGFAVLSDTAVVSYKTDNLYAPAADFGVRYDDPHLRIDWRLSPQQIQISERDKQHPPLAELPPYFRYGRALL